MTCRHTLFHLCSFSPFCLFCFVPSPPSLPLPLFIPSHSYYPIYLSSSSSRAIRSTALSASIPILPPAYPSNVHPPNRHHPHLPSQTPHPRTPNPPLNRMPHHKNQLRLHLPPNHLPQPSKPQLTAPDPPPKRIGTRVVVAGSGGVGRLHSSGAGGAGEREWERAGKGGGRDFQSQRNGYPICTSRAGATHSTPSLSSPLPRPTTA